MRGGSVGGGLWGGSQKFPKKKMGKKGIFGKRGGGGCGYHSIGGKRKMEVKKKKTASLEKEGMVYGNG